MENNTFVFYPKNTKKVIAGVFNPETNTIRIGKAECSDKDKFCKTVGRNIAIGRANCRRELTERQFVQKGKVIKTNKDLLPIEISVSKITKPIYQFLEVAKTL